jgi:hypothetical protein
VARYWAEGYDLNEGMIFVYEGQVYFGDRAVNALALLSSGSSWFNRVNRILLSNAGVARIAYPVLRFGRNMTLRVRRQAKLVHNA